MSFARKLLFILVGLGGVVAAQAHEPFMDCFDNNDQTITCEAGYEDGIQTTSDDKIIVKDKLGNTLLSGTFSEGRYRFKKPTTDFSVIFVGGTIGHIRRISEKDITKR